jgi:UDP-3-O-[3-hydroxymyristoyl] N-acetylglucosamine deacetylase
VRTIACRYQRTLARPVDVTGTGFITGTPVRARFRPAPANSGIVFIRGDRPGSPQIPALATSVTDTSRRTTLGTNPNSVTLVEHALAALAGLRIDNCTIELNGPELPGLDGSAAGFVEALSSAGNVSQTAFREILGITTPLRLTHDHTTLSIHAATDSSLRISYILDYGPKSPIPRQVATVEITPDSFAHEIAACRTFLLESEANQLRSQGIGRHVNFQDLIVYGPHGVIDNHLRHADEPARHKILDLIGDLSLTGFDLSGHVVAYRSGHSLNVELAKELRLRKESSTANAVLPFPGQRRAA